MAEAIAFSIVADLTTMLGGVAFNEISLAYGVEDEVENLKDTLSTIEAALLDVGQRKEKTNLMEDWIRKLNDAVYDADDVLDAFATKALQRELNTTTDGRISIKKVRDFFSSSNSLVFSSKLAHKIKKMRERFGDIAANMSMFNFTERLTVQASLDNNSVRETISFVLTSDIIGREKDKEEVVKLIMSTRSNEENVTVITIVGMGGLGKTALTQLVYNDKEVVEYFELRLWVCVSDDFEKKSLVKKILKSLTNNDVGDLELEQLQIRLRENLDGKRFLLVLDDIWNEIPQRWEPVKNLLICGAKGSKIVVTSRSKTVASVMETEDPYILKGLTGEESWNLFEKVAFRGHKIVPPNLEVIGKEIIEKCKGVPLAIRSLASVLQSKTQESEWLSIRNSDVWSLCQDDGDILPILKLSYDYLPINLRQCFAYCSIFPKDHIIQKELLIQLWMAQGYIQSSNNSRCLEDIGDQYFMNLLSRSFFQDAKVNDYDEVINCKMHDLVHDLATRVAGSDCTITETYEDDISNRVRHVSIAYPFEELPRKLLKAKGLRTFLRTSNANYLYFYEASTLMSSNFTCLRVLDVHCCGIDKVPSSIGKLQHLRYLDLSEINMTSLPNSIRKLVNLQTLKLSDCYKLKRLPEGITKLINLRYLVTDGCSSLEHMPTGMGKLTSLRRLNKFVVGGKKKSLRLNELNGLKEIRGDLSIEGLKNVKDGRLEAMEVNLMARQYLHSLTLKWEGRKERERNSEFDRNMDEILLEVMQPHGNLRELSIMRYSGQMFPSWMTMTMAISLPNIVSITLEGCYGCQHLPQSLHQLPFLKFLKLVGLNRVEHINDVDSNNNNNNNRKSSTSSSSAVFFPSLEELWIEGLPNLKGWWREESPQRPSFPRLTRLEIRDCEQLTSMPIHFKDLYLYKVPEKLVRQLLLTMAAITITEGSAGSSSSSSCSISSKLKFLSIMSIKDLESLPVEVFRNLVSLEHLEIISCPRLSCFEVSDEQGFTALPSLRTLRISRIGRLESLPEEVFRNLASLEQLEIHECPRLSCFAVSKTKTKEEEEDEEERFTSMRYLSIWRCDSLTSLSAGGVVSQHLTALHDLKIQSCPNFDFSGDHGGVHWQGLRSLRHLTIEGIPKLVSLPLELQQVTTLHRLEIAHCPGLMALPDWISNLTSIQHLNISYCPLLSKRCRKDTGEDWSNISHIPQIEIDLKVIQGTMFPYSYHLLEKEGFHLIRTVSHAS